MQRRLAFLTALSLAHAAVAAPASSVDARKVETQRLNDLAVEAWNRGDYLVALDDFEKAYAIYPTANLQFNIARVLSDLGRDLEALDGFERYLAEAKDPPEQARGIVKAKIAVLSKRVAHLAIDCRVEGARVSVDGRVIGSGPLSSTVRVNPGVHQLTADLAGYAPGLATVNPRQGETLPVTVEPHALRTEKPLTKRWWFWTVLGGAAAASAAAIAVGVVYGQKGTNQPSLGRVSAQPGTSLTNTP